MAQGLLDGDVLELGARAAAERAAGGREHEPLDRARAPRLFGADQLVERRVLGVDRDQPCAALSRRVEHQRAARDEALLVRERNVDARLERCERRAEACDADARVQDVAEELRRMERDADAMDTDDLELISQFSDPRVGEMLSRWDMIESPPDILVANYSMLNVMLMRAREAELFR